MEDRWKVETTGRRPALVWVAFAAAIAAGLCTGDSAHALYLDDGEMFSARLRAYSQLAVATQDSQTFVTDPPKFAGQVMQWRNFVNPEFEANPVSLLPKGWLDDLSGRLALWGFYECSRMASATRSRVRHRSASAGRRSTACLTGSRAKTEVDARVPLQSKK